MNNFTYDSLHTDKILTTNRYPNDDHHNQKNKLAHDRDDLPIRKPSIANKLFRRPSEGHKIGGYVEGRTETFLLAS